MIPTQSELELPLLRAIVALGGRATTTEVYRYLRTSLSDAEDADFEIRMSDGRPKWKNAVQWTRQNLVSKGQMSSPERGVWGITDKGRDRVLLFDEVGEEANELPPDRMDLSFVEAYENYETRFKEKLLDTLLEMEPYDFEKFANKLLTAYGFVESTVTAKNKDGGIDGHGWLRVGLARMHVGFQCKRWQGNIGRPEVDKFRGAIQGAYQQGIFFTTSDFTKEATEASIRPGAVPVILLNGMSIVEMMVEKQFGVRRQPLHLYDESLETVLADDD